MKALRVICRASKAGRQDWPIGAAPGGITQVLEFSDVADAQGIINVLRRKPATTAISQTLLAGGKVEIETR